MTAAPSIWFEVWGCRESGRRNFRFQSIKFPIFRQFFPIFQAKILTTFFSRLLKQLSFIHKYSHFHLFHLHSELILLYFLFKKTRKRPFLTYFLGKIAYGVFRDPFTAPPGTPTTSPVQNLG